MKQTRSLNPKWYGAATVLFVLWLYSKSGSASKSTIDFYHIPGCPYCEKVQDVLDELGYSYVLQNVQNPQIKQQMRQVRQNNKTTVPFLVIDGKPMAESQKIITYLRNTK